MDATTSFDELVAKYRSTLPIVEEQIYLDSAGLAPISTLVVDAIAENLDLRARAGKQGILAKRHAQMEQARTSAATLLRAHPDEIALIHNTTEGLNVIANGFPLKPGDNILIPDNEFPANVYPWLAQQARGAEIRWIPAPGGVIHARDVEARIDARTRLLALSHVGYLSGYRAELAALAEICHARGVRMIVDAAQSLGVVDIDVRALGIDALTGSGWKYLLGPTGTALLHVSRELLPELRTVFLGAGSMRRGESGPAGDTSDIIPTAARFEYSTVDIAAICGLGQSLRWIVELGTDRIAARVATHIDRLRRELPRLGMTLYVPDDRQPRAGIVSGMPAGMAGERLLAALLERGIHCGHWHGYVRFAPHFFTTEAELDALFVVLGELLGA